MSDTPTQETRVSDMPQKASMIVCPACKAPTTVVDSRGNGNGKAQTIRRRRACLGCKERFTTYETVEHPTLAADRAEAARERIVGLMKAFRDEIAAVLSVRPEQP